MVKIKSHFKKPFHFLAKLFNVTNLIPQGYFVRSTREPVGYLNIVNPKKRTI